MKRVIPIFHLAYLVRHSLAVRYDEQRVGYEAAELEQLALAYAVSVHNNRRDR